jgi:Flp pilus assembly protein TadG
MRRGRGSGGGRGSVLVEFVLVLPFLLLLLLAAIDWGWYFVLRQSAIEATREGARTGSVQADTGAAHAAAEDAVTSYLGRAGMSVQTPAVEFPTVSTAGGPITVIEVTLDGYPAGSLTGFSTFVPATITARTTMRLEIQPGP